MKSKIISLSLTAILTANAAFAATFTPESPAGRTGPGLDLEAYELFYSMYDQSIDLSARELYTLGSDRSVPITFGAEKEGSSSKILRVMSPKKSYLVSEFKYTNKALGIWFLQNLINGSILDKKIVRDFEGQVVSINYEILNKLSKIDVSQFDEQSVKENTEIRNQYRAAIEMIEELFPKSPFSFLTKAARKYLWEQHDSAGYRALGIYDSWEPLYGEPEKYIERGHKELNKGWEVIFKPQKTYADFELQISWFRSLMGSKSELFESPGHTRVVMPRIQLTEEQNKVYEGKAAELNRMLMAYIVLRGLKGQTGLLNGKWKGILTEKELANLSTGRGPIRLEKNRFYKNSLGIEFRTGMKDEVVRRFAHAVYASRLATNDMSDLSSIQDWELISKPYFTDPPASLAADFGVTPEQLKRAVFNWNTIKNNGRLLDTSYMVPLWSWQNAPFAQGKKAELNRLTREFIIKLAEMPNPNYHAVSKMVSDWVTASNLIADIENYMTPKKSFDRVKSPLTVAVKEGGIDVNKIDLGNEFTARMPLKLKSQTNSKGAWVQTIYDMTPEEREARIKSVAETLQEKFTGSRVGVVRLNSGSHGHNLSIAYELKDHLARTWRVEWDGVTRNYDSDGNVLESTARGGHIEIVSPKYNPGLEEIKAVFEMMETESLVPDYKMGGSHINVDFEIFEKNPKAMARFLTLFHEHRGIIAFMFQHINRLRSAEPVEVSRNLDMRLRNFNGSQEELAQLLYNEKYYNSRVSRKTRYTQIDVSNFMGNVIPEEFIKPDFDVVKARFTGGDGWSRQFRVTKHKKLEFRLFDAAKDPLEAALQIKVVRALLNKALNDTSSLSLPTQVVNHEDYVNNPQKAYQDLQTLVTDLDLVYADYSPYVTNKLVINKAFMDGKFYVNWFQRANKEFPRTEGWGKALNKARGLEQMIYSDRPIIETGVNSCEKIFLAM